MYRKLVYLAVACFFLSAAVIADDNDGAKPNSLSVSGYVKVYARADRATICFDVKGEGSSLEQAFDRISRKVDSIAARLKTIGIEDSELGTSHFRSAENEGHKAFLSSKRDYKTLMTVTISTTELDLLKNIIFILSESDVELISDISFDLINIEDVRMKALKDATKKAREKARMMADILACRIIRPLTISEMQTGLAFDDFYIRGGRSSNISYEVSPADLSQSGSIYPDRILVEAEVQAEFEIQSITLPGTP